MKKPFRVWALFASVYVTQYIGIAFIFASTVAIMRQLGMPLDKIALINIIALPLLLKIFYAPIIDNIRLKRFIFFGKSINGQYRSWLLFAQWTMVILLITISMLDMSKHFTLGLMLMLAYGFAVSIQDVAIDGLACQEFLDKEHHQVNSIQFSGNLLGSIIGGGFMLMAYHQLGWQGSLLVLASLTAVAWVQLFFFKETFVKRQASIESTQASLFIQIKQLLSDMAVFMKKYQSWFGLLLLYPFAMSASFSLLNPLLVDAGWSLADIGFVTKVFGSIIGMFSALVGGGLISKIGQNKSLFYLSVAQAFSLLTLLPLAYGYTDKLMVYIAVGIFFLLNPALMTTIATHAMTKANEQPAKATFFTLQFGILAFLGFAYAGIAMALSKTFGYASVMMIVFVIAVLVCLRVRQYTFNIRIKGIKK